MLKDCFRPARADAPRCARHAAGLLALAATLLGLPQHTAAQISTPTPVAPAPAAATLEANAASAGPDTGTEYRIGPDDVLSITVLQAPELNASVRVPENGQISLPLIGEVLAAKLTPRELELQIQEQLGARFIRDPHVTVLATEIRSYGVSVVGAVRRPGVLQVRATTSLLEVLSLAGGLAEEAGDSVIVLRKEAGTGSPTSIGIRLKALLGADDSANIPVRPGDIVNVQTAHLVYVMGAVNKPGAFAVRGSDGLTVLRALAYGEGVTALAKRSDAMVLRTSADGQRIEVPVDLESILKGRSPDVALQAQDILFVPVSGAKVASRATLEFLARVATRAVIPF
jgi:polysaccharide export outer membrane protein